MGPALVELYCSIAWVEVEVILNDNEAFDWVKKQNVWCGLT